MENMGIIGSDKNRIIPKSAIDEAFIFRGRLQISPTHT